MTRLAMTTLGRGLTSLFIGLVLVRAAVRHRAWFLAIDPARSEQPLLFWYCVLFTMLSVVGGSIGTAILLVAVP